MKTKKSIHWINTGIFPATIMFCHGMGYDEVVAYCKSKKGDTWAISIRDDKNLWEQSNYLALKRSLENIKTGKFVDHYIIKCKELFKFSDYDYCRLAHECLHICQYLLPDILERTKEHEAEAYLHTHIMSQCLEAIRYKSK